MWKNKHLVVAMLVAPVLAIIAWAAVDRLVGEQPAQAREGAAYLLIAKSNCRYASGQCDLANGNFLVTLKPQPQRNIIRLESSHALDSAVAAVGTAQSGFGVERALSSTEDSLLAWRLSLATLPSPRDSLRLAVSAKGSTYYVTVPLTFVAADGG